MKGAQRPVYNWHHQSIITVITAVLSLLQLQDWPEVFEAPCLCVQCISVDYVKSKLWFPNEYNYTGISSVLLGKEARNTARLARDSKARTECLQSLSPRARE